MVVELCFGVLVFVFEVESIDISDDFFNSDSEVEFLVLSDEEFLEFYKCKNQLDNILGRVVIIFIRCEFFSDFFIEKGFMQRI